MNRFKKYFTVATMLLACVWTSANAQIVYVEDEENDVVVSDDANSGEVIEVPEAMVQDIDSLLELYHTKMYLQPDVDCNMRDVNPYFEPEVYKDRLQRLPTVMEMPYNDVVMKFIDRYATKMRRSVSMMLGASNFYMPVFEQALESYGVPLELKYLPVIESALNPRAVSRVGATGLWQFMLTTGKQYGLTVNSLVDERRDPDKSSYAAAHFLRDLYRIFGDWTLVIAAYNCGPENVNKAIHRAGGAKDYWAIYPYLPSETRGYVPAFIAANYIMNYYCEHNICPMVSTLPAKTDTVMVDRNVHMEQVAKVLNIDIEEIRALNPQYRKDIVCGATEPASLRLPQQYINRFIDNEDAIYAYRASELLDKRAEVEIGGGTPASSSGNAAPSVVEQENADAAPADQQASPYSASRSYSKKKDDDRYSRSRYDRSDSKKSQSKYSRDDDKKGKGKKGKGKNGKDDDKKGKGKGKGKDNGKKGKGKNSGSSEVSIKKGDTLSEIAQRNHTTVAKLKKLNKLSGDNIREGKKLKVK